jgi:integrase
VPNGNSGGFRHELKFGRACRPNTIRDIIGRRAEAAGLGHVSPHDLRRTTASILHRSTTADGAHLFDLLDIQRVLDHSDPATTMRSYIAFDNEADTKERAGRRLD